MFWVLKKNCLNEIEMILFNTEMCIYSDRYGKNAQKFVYLDI